MDNSTILVLTYGIIGVIAVMTIYALVSNRAGVAQGVPSILTSLGIFGTFLGITVGLAGFNPADVQNSIAYLFGGIKLAFWTSVAGILGGILVKFRHLLLYKEEAGAEGTASVADLLQSMQGVERSLTDGANGSLLSELRGLQVAANERGDELYKLLDDMQASSQASSGHLAQLGDSLSSAVGKDLARLQDVLGDKLEQSAANSAQKLNDVAQAITNLKTAMGGDSAALLESLETMVKGSEALGDRLGNTLSAGNATLATALEGNRDALATQIAGAVTDLRDALVGPDGAASALGSQLQRGQVELATALARVSESLRAGAQEDVEALNTRLAQSSASTAEQMANVGKAIEQLQGAMGGDAVAMLDRMDQLRQGSETLGDRLSKVLGANNQALAKALEGNRDVLAAQIATAVTELRDALVGPDGAATALGARLAQGSEASAAQMQNVARAIETLQGAMGGDTAAMLERLESIGKGSEALGDRIGKALGSGNEALAKALEGNRDALAAQIAAAVTDVRDALVGPEGAASDLARKIQEGQIELAGALARSSDALHATMGEDAAAMLERLDRLSGSLNDLGDGVAAAFGESTTGLSGDVSNLAATIADSVDDLRMAIIGPDGAREGIAHEIRAAQTGTSDKLDSIHKALRENTQRQIDYSPKGLMTVLEELIGQFNTQFAGQFWKKIGGFNQAIAELLGWMETYRAQLNDTVDQQTKTARNMDIATRRFDEIASKSEIFIDVSTNMSGLLGGLDSQRVQLESHLKRFAHIVDETSANLQNIEEQIIGGNTNMNEHLSEISERIEAQIIRVDRAMDDELRKALVTFGQQLAALSEKFVEDYTPLTDRLRDVVSIAGRV